MRIVVRPGCMSLKTGAPRPTSTRSSRAMKIGAPTTSIMKMVRRDQSISPTDRSNTRRLEVRNAGAGGSGRAAVGWVIKLGPASLDQGLEDRLEVVVGGRHLVDRPVRSARGQLGQAGVERIRFAGLDHHCP